VRKKAINSAKFRLASAQAAVVEFENGLTVGAQKQAWWRFLTDSAAVYEKLKAGSIDAGGRSAGWFGRVTAARKGDPLLAYIHHARNCEYHGLEETVAARGRSIGIHDAQGRLMFGFVGPSDENDEPTAPPSDIQSDLYVNDVEITAENSHSHGLSAPIRPASLYLVDVVDGRSGKKFPPPELHLGAKIDGTNPSCVAKATIDYLQYLVEQAANLESG
jgi:hypothetical protein